MYSSLCVIGGGGIGGLISYYAFRGGLRDITVYYGSRRSVKAVEKNGGLKILIGGREYFVPVKPYHYTSPAGKCGFIVNAVKAYHLQDTIDLTRRIMDSKTHILLIQNGMGIHEKIAGILGYERVSLGVVFIGASRGDPATIIHNGGNTIYAGTLWGFNTELLEIANVFRRGGCDFRVVSNIGFYRWLKLGVNAVINPLTAIARSPNKIVLSEPGRILAGMIIDEVVEAARRNNIVLDRERLLRIVFRAARNTGENYSSMAQDVMRGGRTEIDYINGYVAGIIGYKSINGALTLIVKLIEETFRDGG